MIGNGLGNNCLPCYIINWKGGGKKGCSGLDNRPKAITL